VQEFLGSRDVVDVAGDVLVKAAVPCFVQAAIILEQQTTTTVDTDAIAAAIAQCIGQTRFTGILYASALSQAVASLLPTGTHVHSITMTGDLYLPDQTIETLSDATALTIPDLPTVFTTGDTVAFFAKPEDITVVVI
jgi:hypothetical protein